ncbi:hypothetical protein [Candidatus Magnetaquicoccus inordinatus]|uniref:hypothetical protein n=1 Tax=Candidatus Magnetaquicoccus inordinatus TaxID=2496818 RepID=UPI00102C2284|nr:hypothetical protein [Candidatus Magnetaquicoccus inordinatus]
MLKLVAIAEEDGWGIVRTDSGLKICQPPYQKWNLQSIPEDLLAQAIGKHGFKPVTTDFLNWKELLAYLKQQQLSACQKLGLPEISEQDLAKLIQKLPAERLTALFDHVENIHLPNGHWQAAENLLQTLLSAQAVINSPVLRTRGDELLKQCAAGKEMQIQKLVNTIGPGKLSFTLTPPLYHNLGNRHAQAAYAFG